MGRIVLGVFDALYSVVSSDASAFFGGLVIHQSAYKSGSIYVTGAVAALGDLVVLVVGLLAVLVNHYASFAGSVGYAGENYGSSTQSGGAL